MLTQRLAVASMIIPTLAVMVYFGGWVLFVFTLIILVVAALEYWKLFKDGGYSPSLVALIAGVSVIVVVRAFFGLAGSDLVISAIILGVMTISILEYERGNDQAIVDFGLSLAGILYIGWLGAYLMTLRELSDGLWWTLLVLPATAFADGGAYTFGKLWGRHSLSKRVSPKKTWEGYLGGVITSVLFTAGLAALWHLRAPFITADKGLVIGAVISIVIPLGDFGVSIIKRRFGVKDSSHLIPGHGGMLDRLDTMLWAFVIGYYLISLLWY
jgi:phosphatidate cytidylyltransferase